MPPDIENTKSDTSRFPEPAIVLYTASLIVTAIVELLLASDTPVIVGFVSTATTFPDDIVLIKYFILDESKDESVKPSPDKGDTFSLVKYVLSLGEEFAKINVPWPVFFTSFSDKLTPESTYLTTSLMALSAIFNSRFVPTLSFIVSESVFNLPLNDVLFADVKLYVTVPLDIDVLLKSPSSLSCKLVMFILSFEELLTLPIDKPVSLLALIVNSNPSILIVSLALVPSALPIVPVKVQATDILSSELIVLKVAFEKSPAKIASLAFVSLIITLALSAEPVNVIPSFVREFLRE